MILVDTSVWIAHFGLKREGRYLADLLQTGRQEILTHPFVIGELSLGGLSAPTRTLLNGLEFATVAESDEVQLLIEQRLAGRGIGYVDAHLLASARLIQAGLWTLDDKLAAVAAKLGVGYQPATH